MKATVIIAGNIGATPFDVFAQDIDDVIMLFNYYTNLKNDTPPASQPRGVTANNRRRVTDATATGGWY